MYGLRRLIVVANHVRELNRVGIEPTAGQIANLTGLSKYKVSNTLTALRNIGVVDFKVSDHRPNAKKFLWFTNPSHDEWIERNHNAQF